MTSRSREIRALLAQHTAATGQAFTEEAQALIGTRTGGQPWLVNAICYDACFRHRPGRDRARPITADAILEAQERLILRRDTHIDDLAHKLREERVRRVVEPILTGSTETVASTEDVAYACDLGLVAQDAAGTPHIANPIYAEVVPRHLNYAVQVTLPQQVAWYVDADGELDVEGLIAAFQEFFREHSEHWVQRFERYHEAGPQLLLQAHLQRIVNGGGRIEREYALGRGRTDLLIVWPQGGRERRFVVECKDVERTIAEGVKQTRGYMDRCAAEAGHLVVFDRTPDRPWAEKIFRRPPSGSRRAGHGLGDVAPYATRRCMATILSPPEARLEFSYPKPAASLISTRRRPADGLAVRQFPAVEYDRQAGEAHRRILPRQAFVRQVLPQLRSRRLRRRSHAGRAGRLAPLQVLELDHVAVAHAGKAHQKRLQADVRVAAAQLPLGVEHEVIGRAQVSRQEALDHLPAVDVVADAALPGDGRRQELQHRPPGAAVRHPVQQAAEGEQFHREHPTSR